MRASTNIALKDRNTLTLEALKGVDFSSSPRRVAANRAADAVNVIYEDGEIKKRKGWQQKQEAFSGRINGIFEYKNGTHKEQIIHVGTDIYVNNSKKSTSDMTVKNTRSSFFMNNGYCYIVCGDILVYGKFDGVYKLKRVADIAYIPTTTINIDAEKWSVYQGIYGENDDDAGQKFWAETVVYPEDTQIAVLEKISLLTSQRKNSLVGLSANEQKDYFTKAVWILDTAIENDSDVTVEMYDEYFQKNTVLTNRTLKNSKESTKNGTDISGIYYYDGNSKNFLCDDEGYIYGYVDFASKKIELIGGTYEVNGQNMYYKREYTIPRQRNNEANITVTFKAAGWEDKRAEITGCTFGTIFGTNGSSSRLFLSGNASCPNRVFYSGYNDFTYFPDVNYINVGSETAKITGFCRLLDNTMAILKEKSFTDPTIYYMTGVQENKYDSSGNLTDGRAVFYVEGGGVGEANINPYVTANLAGDALMLSENGVLGITLTQNMTTGARYVKERSYSINDRLRLYNLSDAAGIVFENRYYLSLRGVCFVADARHKYYREGNDMDQSYNYEWWYWENVPARVWAVVDGKLWFGTEDGRVCAFDTDMYEDITYFESKNGDFDVSVGPDKSKTALEYVSYNAAKYTKEDFEGKYMQSYVDIYFGENLHKDANGYITVDENQISRIHSGDRLGVLLDFASPGEEALCTVTEVDYANLRLKVIAEVDWVYSIYGKAYEEEQTYTMVSLGKKGVFSIINVTDGYFQLEAPWGGVMRLSSTSTTSTIYDYRPISAKWITPYFDMGSSMYGKTLLRLSVTAGEGSDTFLFGYETKRDSSMRPIHGTQHMDFDKFSFNAFSFNNKFASSHTVKTNVRNFNYIRFCFLSEDAVPFSVSKLEALYKINKMNRGVR